MFDMPYFMENNEWYTYDVNAQRYVLTDEATDKARESYEEYYKALEDTFGGKK